MESCSGLLITLLGNPLGKGFKHIGFKRLNEGAGFFSCYTLDFEFMVTQIGCDTKYVELPLLPNRRIKCRAMPHMKIWSLHSILTGRQQSTQTKAAQHANHSRTTLGSGSTVMGFKVYLTPRLLGFRFRDLQAQRPKRTLGISLKALEQRSGHCVYLHKTGSSSEGSGQ